MNSLPAQNVAFGKLKFDTGSVSAEILRSTQPDFDNKMADCPTLTAEDLANAWHYARSHREEIDREIAANADDS